MTDLSDLTKAYEFAASKHIFQRRKGVKDIPYINHPIEVVNLLSHTLDKPNLELLVAAVLHDTLEDTDAAEIEIKQLFGDRVLSLVLEVTDNMKLSKAKRRAKQIAGAPDLSDLAKQIKIADKTCNISDMLTTRIEWTRKMKISYVKWAIEVIDGCREINPKLDNEFDKAVKIAKNVLGEF